MYNISPSIWGPPTWDCLFYICLAYPDNPTIDDKKNILAFFDSIGNLLPCQSCRHNFKVHRMKHHLNENVIDNRFSLLNWLIKIKNEVNSSLNKPLDNYNDIITKYLKNDKTPKKQDTNSFFINFKNIDPIYIYIILIIFVITILSVYVKYRNNY